MNGKNTATPLRVYMALETGSEEREKLQFLTTQVMRWSEEIWILDISPFFRYWQIRSQAAGSAVIPLWRTALDQIFDSPDVPDREKIIPLVSAYRATCAVNPWLSVLMLYEMQSRNIRGLVPQQSRVGQTLLKSIGWKNWWRGTSTISDHFLTAKTKGFKPANFRKQCHRLKLGMARLGIRQPAEMNILNESGVKKRFGAELGRLWRWTFAERSGRSPSALSENSVGPAPFLQRSGFPWQDFRFRDSPLVKRCLDYPLERWEQVAPLLVEDLDKLCGRLENSGEQVSRIDWQVTLDDMKQLQVPIGFRNPHNLLREKGKHRTALSLAERAFEGSVREQFPPTSAAEEAETAPLINNWELVLSETLIVPDIFFDIFGEIAGKEGDLDILLRLENELPVPLNRFVSCKDWLPEDSYTCTELDWKEAESSASEMQRSLDAVAEERPLYIRSQPTPLPGTGQKRQSRFLESTLNKWWQTGGGIERNYFKHIDSDGIATWIFQDSAGNWYQHGIFG